MLLKSLFLIYTIFFLSACDDEIKNTKKSSSIVSKKDRIFEIDITEPQTKDYFRDIQKVKSIGAQSISISLDWTVIEVGFDKSTSTPIYASDDDDLLQIIDDYYQSENLQITLTLRPIITLIRNTPEDLNDYALNSPEVIARFKLLLNHVITKLSHVELTSLVIGSEVDLYLQNEQLQEEYLNFYSQISLYAREKYQTTYPKKKPLKISVESTYHGLTDIASKEYFLTLNQYSDVIGISYYPIKDAVVKEPNIVHKEFKTLIDIYPNKALYFYQLGYPSGYFSANYYEELQTQQSHLNSSEEKQAAFIDEVFVAWDTYEQNIKLIDFTWMHDLSHQNVIDSSSNPAFGGTNNPALEFAEFLRTLGLRTYDNSGVDKKAFLRLKENAKLRGW